MGTITQTQFLVQFTRSSESQDFAFSPDGGYVHGSFVESDGDVTTGLGVNRKVMEPKKLYAARFTMPVTEDLLAALDQASENPLQGTNPYYLVTFAGQVRVDVKTEVTLWPRTPDIKVISIEPGEDLGGRHANMEALIEMASANSDALDLSRRQEYLANQAAKNPRTNAAIKEGLLKGFNLLNR
jgi:hypothetical protein